MTDYILPEEPEDELLSMLSAFQADDTVLHYRIIDAIGEGGMGEVYKAEDLKLGRTVALKVLSPALKKDQTAAKRLVHEARAASALNHPHIVTIYAIEEWKGVSFLVMEFLEGQSLGVRLALAPLSLPDLLEIGAQTAEALGAAHAAGLIHRDIKPQNIMIVSDDPLQIKLLDFGLAKKIFNPKDAALKKMTKLTTAGVPIGTIPYMSPEQTRAEMLDSRSDIFSLGSTLYEAATRRLPFEGNSILTTMDNIANADPVPPSEVVPGIPPRFDDILSRALAKEKEDRFQSAFEFGAQLRDLKASLTSDFQLPFPVSQIQYETAQTTPASSAEYVVTKVKQHKKSLLISLLALILIFGAIGYFLTRERGAIRSLAVLPFANANANPQDEYLSEGVTENIINNLSQIPQLRVMARTTVFRFEGKRVDPREAGRELKLDAVVTGSIYREGDTVMVEANLVRVSDGAQLWGDQYNRKVADVLTVQSDISREISEKLRLKLTGAEQQKVAKKYTVNAEAYELYLRALYFWNRRTVGFDYMRKALEYFEMATQKDPQYALAYAGVSDAYTILGNFQEIPPKDAYTNAEAAVKKAIALDDSLAEAHISLAGLKESQLDWKSAGIEYQRGLALKQNYPTAQEWYGLYLMEMGQTQEAVKHIKQAVALDPFALIMNAALGLSYFYDRHYDRSIDAYRKTLELDPNQTLYSFLGHAYEQNGQYKEAVAEYLREFRLPESGKSREVIQQYEEAFKTGGIEAWRKKDLEEELKQTAQGKRYFETAIAYTLLGNKEEAFKWLQKAIDENNIDLWMLRIKPDPRVDSLRADPRFAEILKRLGLV